METLKANTNDLKYNSSISIAAIHHVAENREKDKRDGKEYNTIASTPRDPDFNIQINSNNLSLTPKG